MSLFFLSRRLLLWSTLSIGHCAFLLRDLYQCTKWCDIATPSEAVFIVSNPQGRLVWPCIGTTLLWRNSGVDRLLFGDTITGSICLCCLYGSQSNSSWCGPSCMVQNCFSQRVSQPTKSHSTICILVFIVWYYWALLQPFEILFYLRYMPTFLGNGKGRLESAAFCQGQSDDSAVVLVLRLGGTSSSVSTLALTDVSDLAELPNIAVSSLRRRVPSDKAHLICDTSRADK